MQIRFCKKQSSLIIVFVCVGCLASLAAFKVFNHAEALVDAKEAMYYAALDDNKVQCQLCPRHCVIASGKRGFCGVRESRGGTLYTLVYGKPCAVHIDPMEKKPLFHFFPKSRAFSIATVGCNLRCKFCQNWQISQAAPEDVKPQELTPEEIVTLAVKSQSRAIAYTYTEPTIFYEYMIAIAKLAKERGIKNVMHSAGHINPGPLRALCKYLDAANIDLKGFSRKYYQEMSLGNLDSVLQTLKILKEEGVWLEITNLVLPGYNDDPKVVRAMCDWIRDNLGPDTPLHLSRFVPMYKLLNLSPTPQKTLEQARQTAMDAGLKYVYIGNIAGHEAENTYCPKCGKVLIERKGYSIGSINIESGKCTFCEEAISGVWK